MDGWMDGHGSFCVYRKGLLFLIPTVEPGTWYFVLNCSFPHRLACLIP